MKRLAILFHIVFISHLFASAQGTWVATAANILNDRYDDIYFINPDTGWAISMAAENLQPGQIIKTTDGGTHWSGSLASGTAMYRDIGFLDANTGFTGTLEASSYGDTALMYKSVDGGLHWLPVQNLPGPRPAGICGMRVINDSTLYACGRYSGPAGFYKTTNKGLSWSYINLDSLAGGLVDAYFFDKDTGYIVGGSSLDWQAGRGVVLGTTNGGNTWRRIRLTDHDSSMCWKMTFPSRLVGYASMESFMTRTDSLFCMKTIDGGLTWHELYYATDGGLFAPTGFEAQGIGFIDENTGWIGGRKNEGGGVATNYKTEDGGATWTLQHWGKNLNRFRNMGNGIAYFSGSTIYKLSCNAATRSDSVTICPGQIYTAGGQTFNVPGNYTVTLPQGQCDSTISLKLQNYVVQTPVVHDSAGAYYTGNYTGYQWYFNGAPLAADTLYRLWPIENGTYKVVTTDVNNCLTESAPFNVTTLAIANLPGAHLTLYPNPADGTLLVAGLADKTPIVITSITGQKLITDVANGGVKKLDVSRLAAGVYFLNKKKFIRE